MGAKVTLSWQTVATGAQGQQISVLASLDPSTLFLGVGVGVVPQG